MLAIFDAAVAAASHVVVAVSNAIEPALGDAATAGAIVLVTLVVRLLLAPLSYRAARVARARLALRPKELQLRRRFRDRPARLRQELYDLYRKHQISRFAGIAPLLAQAPFFMVLYRLFLSPTVNGHANALLTHTLLGVPLGDRWLADVTTGVLPPDLLVFGTVFVLLLVVAWWSSRQARQALQRAPATTPDGVPAGVANGVQTVVSRLTRLAPYATVVIAAFVPLATGLYLLTTTAWAATERLAFRTYLASAPAS